MTEKNKKTKLYNSHPNSKSGVPNSETTIPVITRQSRKIITMATAKSSNLAKSEVERIRKEAREEAIKETEAKFKRKIQETFQCIVCLQVPRDGHIVQCQNGHLACEVCANKNNANQCPSCRAQMDQLTGNKRIRTLAAEQLIESMDISFPCKHLTNSSY